MAETRRELALDDTVIANRARTTAAPLTRVEVEVQPAWVDALPTRSWSGAAAPSAASSRTTPVQVRGPAFMAADSVSRAPGPRADRCVPGLDRSANYAFPCAAQECHSRRCWHTWRGLASERTSNRSIRCGGDARMRRRNGHVRLCASRQGRRACEPSSAGWRPCSVRCGP